MVGLKRMIERFCKVLQRVLRMGDFKRVVSNVYLLFAVRLVLGAILIISGFAKLSYPGSRALDPQMAEALTAIAFIPLDLVHFYVRILPWIELAIASFLLFGLFSRIFSGLCVLMVTSFITSNAISIYYSFDACSNCFGALLKLNLPQALAIDIIMLGIAVWIFVKRDVGISVDHWRLRKTNSPKRSPDD